MTVKRYRRPCQKEGGTMTDGAGVPMVMLPYRKRREKGPGGGPVPMGMLPYWIRKVIGPSWGPYGDVALQRTEVKGPGWTVIKGPYGGAYKIGGEGSRLDCNYVCLLWCHRGLCDYVT